MKRKIAILLSAMMVASAMPMTASAVQLKGDTDINAGFPKADQTIDTNYNFNGKIKYDANGNLLDSSNNTIQAENIAISSSELRDRYSVLKLNLINGDTSGDIPAGTTFKLNLENGTFDKDLEHYFEYIQTSDGKLVTKKESMKGITSQSSLTDVFTNVANAYDQDDSSSNDKSNGWKDNTNGQINIDSGLSKNIENVAKQLKRVKVLLTIATSSDTTFLNGLNGVSDLVSPVPGTENFTIKNDNTNIIVKDPATNKTLTLSATNNWTESQFVDLFNFINKTNFNSLSGIVGEARSEYKDDNEKKTGSVDLPHIPYYFSIESEKTASITIPVDIKESDKSISLTGVSYVFEDEDVDFIGVNNVYSLTNLKNISTLNIGTPTLKEGGATISNPYLAIPLGAVKADSDAPVKVTVDGGYSQKIISGTYTITKGSVEGSTSLVFPDSSIKTFDEDVVLEPIVIRENTKNTMGKTNNLNEVEFTIRLDGGFKFADIDKFSPMNTWVSFNNFKTSNTATGRQILFDDSSNIPNNVEVKVTKLNDSALKFHVRNLNDPNTSLRNKAIGLRFENVKVEPINDNNYGDVTFTISGDGINTQSKVVARRNELGFKLETTKDPQEMIVGRHYGANNYGITSGSSLTPTIPGIGSNGQLDGASMLEKDNTTVEIKFSEAIPNTLVETRQLDFIVPDGVKIVDAKIYDTKNFNSGLTEDKFEIVNNGKTLRLNSAKKGEYSVVNRDKIAEFKMTLDLSIDPAFTGDVKLGVTGGGQGNVVETVVAKAKAPFELKTQTTKANMGYQDYNTADIVITETKPGMFLENRTATLSLVAPYGTSELGFSEAKYEVSGGELEIKERDFKVGKYTNGTLTNDGVISFRIDKASHKNPSTVTIKNVKVGTTRSVPFGSYSLALAGDAVLNNYNGAINDATKFKINGTSVGTTSPELANLYMQNNTSYFEFKDYVNVITETGTLDHTVKVSVGEKTVLLGDKAIDMDVAPYIQASSNSTMVPLRFVSVALGVDTASVSNPDASNKISYDANTKTATIYYGAGTGQKIIQFQAGSNIMTVDGTRIPMEYGVKAEIKDNRMFVPFRALGQALGVTVTWDADTRTAIYNADNARNANVTSTTAASSTTTESTTESTTASTTTESTTKSDSTTESTTAKQQ